MTKRKSHPRKPKRNARGQFTKRTVTRTISETVMPEEYTRKQAQEPRFIESDIEQEMDGPVNWEPPEHTPGPIRAHRASWYLSPAWWRSFWLDLFPRGEGTE